MTSHEFDVVVLGAGSGGYSAALRAAQLGRRVALIEEDRVGGTCLHRGCIPTKTILHAAEVADAVRDAGRHGVLATLGGVDPTALASRRDDVVGRLHAGLTGLLGAREVTVVAGTGRVTADGTVAVGDDVYTAADLVLATGSEPILPEVFASAGSGALTSAEAIELDRIPEVAVVLGGGVIGCEFASAWSSLGAQVTIVEARDRLLPDGDPDISRRLERAFTRRGIRVRTGTTAVRSADDDGAITVHLDDGTALGADAFLVAIGRRPRVAPGVADLVEFGPRGHVLVDADGRTSRPGVWAVGDLVDTPQLAHAGFQEGRHVAELICGLDAPPLDPDAIPRIAYSSPEVVSVGRTGHGERTVVYDLAGNGKTQILGGSGVVKLVADAGRVVAAHAIGPRVSELAAELQLIVGLRLDAVDVASLIHPHPTQSEAVGEALLALTGRPLHAHG